MIFSLVRHTSVQALRCLKCIFMPGVYQQSASPVGYEASIPTPCGSQSCWNGCGVELGLCQRCALQDCDPTAATIGEPLFWDFHRWTEGQQLPAMAQSASQWHPFLRWSVFSLNHVVFELRTGQNLLLDLRLSVQTAEVSDKIDLFLFFSQHNMARFPKLYQCPPRNSDRFLKKLSIPKNWQHFSEPMVGFLKNVWIPKCSVLSSQKWKLIVLLVFSRFPAIFHWIRIWFSAPSRQKLRTSNC